MAIDLRIASQRAINELSSLYRAKRGSLIKSNLPTVDLSLQEGKAIFYRIYRLILNSHNLPSDCKMRVETMKDLENDKWLISVSSNVAQIEEQPQVELRQLIEKAGGELSVEKKVKGTVIWFTLPCKKLKL